MKIKKIHINILVSLLLAAVMFLPNILSVLNTSEPKVLFYYDFIKGISPYSKPDPSQFSLFIRVVLPFFFLVIMYCRHIYKDFVTTGIYYFTRNTSRSKWYFNKTITICIHFLIFYSVFFISGAALVAFTAQNINPVADNICLVLSVILAYSFFSIAFILAINILSVKFGSPAGIISVMSLVLLFLFLALTFEKKQVDLAFALNPVAALVPDWHTVAGYSAATFEASNPTSMWVSVAYLASLATAAVIIGYIVINRSDVSIAEIN